MIGWDDGNKSRRAEKGGDGGHNPLDQDLLPKDKKISGHFMAREREDV